MTPLGILGILFVINVIVIICMIFFWGDDDDNDDDNDDDSGHKTIHLSKEYIQMAEHVALFS